MTNATDISEFRKWRLLPAAPPVRLSRREKKWAARERRETHKQFIRAAGWHGRWSWMARYRLDPEFRREQDEALSRYRAQRAIEEAMLDEAVVLAAEWWVAS